MLALLVSAAPAFGLTTDLVTRTTIAAHIPANGYNYPVLGASADGRYAVFGSLASNLVANDTNHSADVFVYDAASATIERVSVASNGSEGNADIGYGYDISADGRYVVFASYATNLVPGTTDEQVYLRDRQMQSTTLISANTSGMPGAGNSYQPRISGDGHYATFLSCAHDLVAADTSTVCNVYRRDLWAGATEIVSVGMGGNAGDGNSTAACSSTDGRFVAFRSLATNLVAGDTNGVGDVFVRDMMTQSTLRASLSDTGGQLVHGGNLLIGQGISGDGRYLIFATRDAATAAPDTNLQPDVYERDLVNNTTTLISATPGGSASDADSYPMSIAANGTVLFYSNADDLVPGTQSTLYVYSPAAVPAVSALLPTAPYSTDIAGALSAYGTVAFFNSFSGLLSGDTSDSQNYSMPIGSATITEISGSPAGYIAAFADNDSYEPAAFGGGPTISADGRFVAFTSFASNLVAGDTNAAPDVFLRDRLTQSMMRISTTAAHAQSAQASYAPVISADGRYVAFTSAADLAAPDNNSAADVYRYDRLDYSVSVVNVNGAGQIGNAGSDSAQISDDGNVIVFRSSASNLVAGEVVPMSYIFVRDISAGVTQRVSVGIGGAEANDISNDPVISGDGNVVCFDSLASNLVSGVSGQHLYAYDRSAGSTEQIDVGPAGQQPNYGSASCGGLSRDGRYAVFTSPASNLDPSVGVSGYVDRVYLRDRLNNTTTLISKNNDGIELDRGTFQPHLSGDGRYATFVSVASNYDPLSLPDYSYTYRIYVYDTASAVLFPASLAPDGSPADSTSISPHLSRDGKRVVFSSYADNLTPLDGNAYIVDVFVAEHYLDVIFASGFETCAANIGCP